MSADAVARAAVSMPAGVRLAYVYLPVWAAKRGEGLYRLVADGHWLAGLGRVTSLVPLAALLLGVLVGWQHWGFERAVTESTGLVIGLLAIGTISGQAGVLFVAGFIAGDFLLGSTTWTVAADPLDPTGITGNSIVAGLVFERVPLLIHYLVVAALVIGVPSGTRGLVSTMSVKLRGGPMMKLFATAVLTAVTAFVLVRFWSSAAPHVVRPLFTWEPGGLAAPPPLDAIASVQNNPLLPRAAGALMLLRSLGVGLISRSRAANARLTRIEAELSLALLNVGPLTPPSRAARIRRAAMAAVASVLFLAGLMHRLWPAAVLFVIFLIIRLSRTGVLAVPSDRWRDAVSRIPVIIRFVIVLIVTNGLASTAIGGNLNRENFEFLLWPIAAGVGLLAIALPEQRPHADEPRGERQEGRR